MKGTKIMYGNRIFAQLIGINLILTVLIGIKSNWQVSSDFAPYHQLTTQISACLQEQVGLMSISSCTRSFSSSPRTWLNFFMKSWAFPASGRFSANSKMVKKRISKCRKPSKKCHCASGHMRIFNSLAIFISFPNIAVLLASDCRCKGQEKHVNMIDIRDYVGFFCDMLIGAYHWQLVEVQQLLDEPSQHVLTLPHLVQGPVWQVMEQHDKECWWNDVNSCCIFTANIGFACSFNISAQKKTAKCVPEFRAMRRWGVSYFTALMSRQAYR